MGDSAPMSPVPTTPTTHRGKQRMMEEEEDLDEVGAEDAFIGGGFSLSLKNTCSVLNNLSSPYICTIPTLAPWCTIHAGTTGATASLS